MGGLNSNKGNTIKASINPIEFAIIPNKEKIPPQFLNEFSCTIFVLFTLPTIPNTKPVE